MSFCSYNVWCCSSDVQDSRHKSSSSRSTCATQIHERCICRHIDFIYVWLGNNHNWSLAHNDQIKRFTLKLNDDDRWRLGNEQTWSNGTVINYADRFVDSTKEKYSRYANQLIRSDKWPGRVPWIESTGSSMSCFQFFFFSSILFRFFFLHQSFGICPSFAELKIKVLKAPTVNTYHFNSRESWLKISWPFYLLSPIKNDFQLILAYDLCKDPSKFVCVDRRPAENACRSSCRRRHMARDQHSTCTWRMILFYEIRCWVHFMTHDINLCETEWNADPTQCKVISCRVQYLNRILPFCQRQSDNTAARVCLWCVNGSYTTLRNHFWPPTNSAATLLCIEKHFMSDWRDDWLRYL